MYIWKHKTDKQYHDLGCTKMEKKRWKTNEKNKFRRYSGDKECRTWEKTEKNRLKRATSISAGTEHVRFFRFFVVSRMVTCALFKKWSPDENFPLVSQRKKVAIKKIAMAPDVVCAKHALREIRLMRYVVYALGGVAIAWSDQPWGATKCCTWHVVVNLKMIFFGLDCLLWVGPGQDETAWPVRSEHRPTWTDKTYGVYDTEWSDPTWPGRFWKLPGPTRRSGDNPGKKTAGQMKIDKQWESWTPCAIKIEANIARDKGRYLRPRRIRRPRTGNILPRVERESNRRYKKKLCVFLLTFSLCGCHRLPSVHGSDLPQDAKRHDKTHDKTRAKTHAKTHAKAYAKTHAQTKAKTHA